MGSDKHRMPDIHDPVWGLPEVRHPENTPGWFLPYENFLSKYCRLRRFGPLRLRIEFARDLPSGPPGDSEGVTIHPFLIQLSIRVRWHLFQGSFLSEGALVLFRQIAYVEFWQRNPFLWPFRWARNREMWESLAFQRAQELLQIWVWNQEQVRERRKPPLKP